MSDLNFILNRLKVKGIIPDPSFSEPTTVVIRGREYTAFHAIQDMADPSCPHCSGNAIGYGYTRTSHVRIPDMIDLPSVLSVRKRRYRCVSCSRTFLTETNLTDRHCFISNVTKSGILRNLCEKVSMIHIARRYRVSDATVLRVLSRVDPEYIEPVLPEVLMIDEFRSVSTLANIKMTFSLMDGKTHELLTIVDDRKYSMLHRHFNVYSESVRRKVRYIVMDMYAPYMTLCRSLFPEARIVIDRFHIIQHVSRALNSCRVAVMKKVSSDKELYKIFKSHWRVVVKSRRNLRFWSTVWVPHMQTYKTEDYLLERMLDADDSLRTCYWLYQTLIIAMRARSRKMFENMLNDLPDDLPQPMKEAMATLRKYRRYIVNSIECDYSNGPMEAMNNNIKVLKRTAYGYRNLFNFKRRIYLVYTNMMKVA